MRSRSLESAEARECRQREETREILRQVRRVEIRSRRAVDDLFTGASESLFKGSGIDFAEVREYEAGDDIRAIDWNVTARMDRPFLKTYREEREQTILIAVDLSASGDFGSGKRSKREFAAEVAAVIALSASRNRDKVGLLLFTDQIELFLAPKKGRQHLLRIIREILFFEPEGRETDISGAFEAIGRLLKRRAICITFSDFLDFDRSERSGRFLKMIHRRHDLVCVELFDRREAILPDVGPIVLEDAETGELVEIDTRSRRVRERYEEENRRRLGEIDDYFKRLGVDHLRLSVNEPYQGALRRFFAKR